MSPAFLACLVLAIFIIVVRGPLIFAPEATARYYQNKLLATRLRVRVLGSVMLVIAILLVATTVQRTGEVLPTIMLLMGILIGIGSFVLLLAPGFVIGNILSLVSLSGPIILRIIGIVSVALALLLIYVAYLYL